MLKRIILLILFVPVILFAQEVEKYQQPPKEIVDLVDAPVTPVALLNSTNDWALLLEAPPLLRMEDLSQPELKLAGLRFNPQTHDQTRPGYYIKVSLLQIAPGKIPVQISLPSGARVRNPAWSPDGKRFAFTISGTSGVELWTGDVSSHAAKRLGSFYLNQVYPSSPFTWLSDSQNILARIVTEAPSSTTAASRTPSGPVIQETANRKAPVRTYQDLLKTPEDAALFERHLMCSIARIALDGSTAELMKGTIERAEASPDGKYILVEKIHRPYSYLVPEFRFPYTVEIYDANGELVKQMADLPLADAVPVDFDAVRTGPREHAWRQDQPATLYWIEAQDEGDPRVEKEIRDRVYMLAAPFTEKPVELGSLQLRFERIDWGGDDLALVTESWWKDRKTKTWRISPSNSSAKPQLVFDRSSEDRYSDPGEPVFKYTQWGTLVMRQSNGNTILLSGDGASPEGDRPFLDALDLTTNKTKRLWRSEAPNYEYIYEVMDDDAEQIMTSSESVSEPPNYFLRNLKRNKIEPLTNFPHPTPQLANAKKELIRYKRADGIDLTGTLYLPPGFDQKKDGALPVLMWAYPQEFKSSSAAGQVTDSPYRFIRVYGSSPLFWLVRGYAILDDPSMPIIGEGKSEPNDTYVEQLVASAQAAVDELVRRGVGDRNRMAIGGHSYGAFMAANLLAHSDLFRAGIARSGAYNRTLTPFSFQAEERTFWEATDTYIKMSPFTYSNKINEPILLIHGMDDNNTGTFPIQSERLYQAIKGLGGSARLVMLPYESHGYRARESVLHVLYEMDRWLEMYVKEPGNSKQAENALR
ncbi:MAG TPA: prolyl oligopeptidase family serine peptidase [Acidobacteriota bacterium]|nr:prolyl oligopeptidase family serine peptidase [Acidobacteriota bacterium]